MPDLSLLASPKEAYLTADTTALRKLDIIWEVYDHDEEQAY